MMFELERLVELSNPDALDVYGGVHACCVASDFTCVVLWIDVEVDGAITLDMRVVGAQYSLWHCEERRLAHVY